MYGGSRAEIASYWSLSKTIMMLADSRTQNFVIELRINENSSLLTFLLLT
jgi:hypothetical protein